MVIDTLLTSDSYGGDCIAHLPDGRALFVPFGITGEKVRVEITEEKKNYARGKIVEVIEPSSTRINPRCPHFTDCGGCHYQHLAYADQLTLKQRILTQQLERLGKITNPPVQPIVASPLGWNYRNTVQFHLTAQGQPGFQEPGSHLVVPVEQCLLCEPAINEIWQRLDFSDAEQGVALGPDVPSDLAAEIAGVDLHSQAVVDPFHDLLEAVAAQAHVDLR